MEWKWMKRDRVRCNERQGQEKRDLEAVERGRCHAFPSLPARSYPSLMTAYVKGWLQPYPSNSLLSMPCPSELVREDTAGSDWGTKKWVSEGTVKVEERRDDWKGHDVRALSFLLIGSHVPSYQLFLSPALISLSERGMSDQRERFPSPSCFPFSFLISLLSSLLPLELANRGR